MFDVIERLKAEWTDKYVVVDSPAPELARFAKATGQVRTVNMNGRCLVEFEQFNNTGWYDIDPARLKVVPKPEKPPEGEKPQAKAAPKAAATDTTKPAPKPAAAAGATGKPSTADILAAARAKAGGPPAAKPSGAKPSTADILAAARAKGGGAGKQGGAPTGEKTPAAADRPSTAEILARARAGKPAAAEEPAAVGEESAAADAPPDPAPVAKPATKAVGGSALPTTTAEKIAWCRAHDAKG